mmetsp:Transcript_18171/g.46141  ORF Transcript_18171/g.46141 Transcript_18171/m.46141 type:complete len:246 (-) Transcript_18171:911-1648(-)
MILVRETRPAPMTTMRTITTARSKLVSRTIWRMNGEPWTRADSGSWTLRRSKAATLASASCPPPRASVPSWRRRSGLRRRTELKGSLPRRVRSTRIYSRRTRPSKRVWCRTWPRSCSSSNWRSPKAKTRVRRRKRKKRAARLVRTSRRSKKRSGNTPTAWQPARTRRTRYGERARRMTRWPWTFRPVWTKRRPKQARSAPPLRTSSARSLAPRRTRARVSRFRCALLSSLKRPSCKRTARWRRCG